jgi:sulfide:quinone oxidoreductase
MRPARSGRIMPEQNLVKLKDGRAIGYDYLVMATGPALAFDEIEGLGPTANSGSICHVDHAAVTAERWKRFCDDPGPIVVGAVQGASCFGPAYEFAFLANADLRRRKIRDRVPITFVTSEPYIGHLGLGGVGDTKGLLEAAMRDRDIRWITNAKIDRIAADAVDVIEVAEDGSERRRHHLASKLSCSFRRFAAPNACSTRTARP